VAAQVNGLFRGGIFGNIRITPNDPSHQLQMPLSGTGNKVRYKPAVPTHESRYNYTESHIRTAEFTLARTVFWERPIHGLS